MKVAERNSIKVGTLRVYGTNNNGGRKVPIFNTSLASGDLLSHDIHTVLSLVRFRKKGNRAI